ncbi:MAG: flagellar filament capping protein FliD [Proteobacteria bacterium]|nr:flagellar filament capping protein FliD [Pseudomonadota bacterium]MBU1388923.1 flagellar filament capping protein FliD [Pseudomonadota bacterium]MBU1543475.1 flagellar filament capping protein FliD [Pseudomonadota bacterium]MBU2431030.1 flagellar filament capping protein FliD [Pseudomonadota bacterium]MBU2480233.1 flagellar filament capping protein FliD [Pseudomonadota bacterium]
MAGSITTLGIGSGLDLQNILDQLKEAEQAPITSKQNEKSKLQKEVKAYNSVNTRLFSMKSNALSLSLESNFLKNTVSVSDDDILTATANDGISQSSHNIEVTQKAQFNSWQTAGVESAGSIIYEGPETGIASQTQSVTTESSTMTILYGALENQQSIEIGLTSGMSLDNIINTINTSDTNKDEDGKQLVMASIQTNNGEYYIRIAAASGGNSAETQVSVAGYDFAMADTTVSIAIAGQEDPMYLDVAPGTTYEQIAAAINSASDNPGVTASIIDTGTAENPFRLTLTSNATGENNRISLQNLPLAEVTGAEGASLNAIFKVNGVEYQRQSNDAITDVISGVTLNLKKTGETSIGIQTNLEPVKKSIISLIEGFNKLVSDISKEDTEDTEETDKEPEENPLSGSFDIKNMISRLRALISTSINTESEYMSLVDLGLEINKDGTMTLDETVLEQALAANPEAVQSLFIGDSDAGITGLGDTINDGISVMVSSQGLVLTEIDAAQTKMDRLDKDILSATERLDKRYKTMTAQFVRLDTYISRLNNESAFMQSMIDSFNKTTE